MSSIILLPFKDVHPRKLCKTVQNMKPVQFCTGFIFFAVFVSVAKFSSYNHKDYYYYYYYYYYYIMNHRAYLQECLIHR